MADDPNAPDPQTTPAPAPASSPPAPEPSAEPKFVPLSRFEATVGEKYEAIRKAEQATLRAQELEQQLEQLRRTPASPPDPSHPAPTAPPPGLTQVELERLATVRAEQMRFAERCNEDVAAGRKKFQDFDAKIEDLRRVAPTVDAQGRPMLPQGLIEAALATGRGHEVLYALGSDPSEADRVLSLDPTRQAVELTRIADKLAAAETAAQDDPEKIAEAAKRAAQNAPARPIRPVVGGSRQISVKDMALDDPALPIEEFMRRRDEEAGRSRRPNGRFR